MTTLQDLAKEAKAAEEFIGAVSRILKDASRSVVVEVTNATTQTLRLVRTAHEHGAFAHDGLPAETIGPMQSDVFGSRSAEGGVMTGTEGRVWYTLDGAGTHLYARWNVPFLSGGNDCNSHVEGPNQTFYTLADAISGGNKKVACRFIIGEHASLGPTDSDWITCGECKGLCYRLDGGKCPGRVDWGGRRPVEVAPGQIIGQPRLLGHQGAGHLLRLSHGVPGPSREGGWRKCKRCKQLFFDGFDHKGACPKWDEPRPGHVAEEGGHEYFLQFDVQPRPTQQNDWRFCTRCHVLFFLPHNADGNCAVGGHHHAHPYNYVIDRVPTL